MFAVGTLCCVLAFLFSTFVLSVSSTTTTLYVSPFTGNDNNNCSFDFPCQTIPHVVPLIAPGDEICLFNGTFTYGAPINISNTTLTISAFLSNESIIDCRGMCSGFILSNVSLLLEGVQINNCIQTTMVSDNAYNTSFVGGAAILAGNNSVLNLTNCFFSNNTAIGSSQEQQVYGGAVFVYQSPQVVVFRCSFYNNSANASASFGTAVGGAIFVVDSPSVTISESDFIDNWIWADFNPQAGGICTTGCDSVLLSWNRFFHNQALGTGDNYWTANPQGGAISIIDVMEFTVNHCEFRENSVIGPSGLLDYDAGNVGGGAVGGGLFMTWGTMDDTVNVSILDSDFIENSVQGGEGGDVGGQAEGAAVFIGYEPPINISIRGVHCINNYAKGGEGLSNAGGYVGAALYISARNSSKIGSSEIEIDQSYFTNNSVYGGHSDVDLGGQGLGGAAFLMATKVNMTRCTFMRNCVTGGTTEDNIGGVAIGGGAVLAAVTASVSDCWFERNRAKGGNACAGVGGEGDGASLAVFSISGDSGNETSNVTVRGCTFQQNTAIGGFNINLQQQETNGGKAVGDLYFDWGPSSLFSPPFHHIITVENSSFIGSTARGGLGTDGGAAMGGAIYCATIPPPGLSLLNISHCLFSGAYSVGGDGQISTVLSQAGDGGSCKGGAVFLGETTHEAVFDNVHFINCSANGGVGGDTANMDMPGGSGGSAQGGAIYSLSSTLSLCNCSFAYNSAVGGAGGWSSASSPPAMFEGGPAIGGAVQTQKVTISSTGFYNNAALTSDRNSSNPALASGGALSAVTVLEVGNNSWFLDNRVYSYGRARGGAVLLASMSTIYSTDFTNNTISGFAEAFGGAVATPSAQTGLILTASLLNVVFSRNSAINSSKSYTSFGGGIFYNASQGLTLSNCTWTTNTAQFGAGAFLGSPSLLPLSSLDSLEFKSNVAVGGGAVFFGGTSPGSNIRDFSALCSFALNDGNNQSYGFPVSSLPLGLNIISYPNDHAIWVNNDFHIFLQLIDLCNQSMMLDQMLVTTNTSSERFDMPYAVSVTQTPSAYQFHLLTRPTKSDISSNSTLMTLWFFSQMASPPSLSSSPVQFEFDLLQSFNLTFLPCPPGYISIPRTSDCQPCLPTEYNLDETAKLCLSCDSNQQEDTGYNNGIHYNPQCVTSPDGTYHNFTIAAGYWPVLQEKTNKLIRCPNGHKSCKAFNCSISPLTLANEQQQQFWELDCGECATTSHPSQNCCQEGYTDRLCARCECQTTTTNETTTTICFFLTASGECQRCKDQLSTEVVIVIGVVFLAALSVVVLLHRFGLFLIVIEIPILTVLLIVGSTDTWVFDLFLILAVVYLITNQSLPSGTTQSFLFYLQATSLLIQGLPWLEWIRSLAGNAFRFTNFQVSGLSCLSPSFTTPLGGFLVYMFTPLALASLIIGIMYVGRALGTMIRFTLVRVILRKQYEWNLSVQAEGNEDQATAAHERAGILWFLSEVDDVFNYGDDNDTLPTESKSADDASLEDLSRKSASSRRISATEETRSGGDLTSQDLQLLVREEDEEDDDDDKKKKTQRQTAVRTISDDDHPHHSNLVGDRSQIASSSSSVSRPLSFYEKVGHAVLFLLYVSYFSLARVILSIFRQCWVDYMPDYPWIRCDSSEYYVLLSLGIVFSLIYIVGLLLLFGSLLYFFRRSILSHSARWFAFFTQAFRDSVYWFEWVLMARRLLLAIAIALIPPQNLLQPSMVILVLLLSLITQLVISPFKRKIENGLEVLSLATLLFTYAISFSFQASAAAQGSMMEDEEGVRIGLFVWNAGVVGAFLVVLFHSQLIPLFIVGYRQVKRILS